MVVWRGGAPGERGPCVAERLPRGLLLQGGDARARPHRALGASVQLRLRTHGGRGLAERPHLAPPWLSSATVHTARKQQMYVDLLSTSARYIISYVVASGLPVPRRSFRGDQNPEKQSSNAPPRLSPSLSLSLSDSDSDSLPWSLFSSCLSPVSLPVSLFEDGFYYSEKRSAPPHGKYKHMHPL